MTISIDNSNIGISSTSNSLKKKKKISYKEMMKKAMTCERTDEEIDNAHKKKLESSVGGGQFKKIDKI